MSEKQSYIILEDKEEIEIQLPVRVIELLNTKFPNPPQQKEFQEFLMTLENEGIKMCYQFNSKLFKMLGEYLNIRPFDEVDAMMTDIFDKKECPLLTKDGISAIFDYLRTTCPRGEIKELIEYSRTQGSITPKIFIESDKKENDGEKG